MERMHAFPAMIRALQWMLFFSAAVTNELDL
jgi:hypothetical protein